MLNIVGFADIADDEWNCFCTESSWAWFIHTTDWMNLILNLKFEKNNINLSFGVYENDCLVAVVPLILEKDIDSGRNELTFSATNSPYPAFSDKLSVSRRKQIGKLIFSEIAEIKDVDYRSFYLCPLIDKVLQNGVKINPLCQYGFHDTTLSTNILDLRRSEEEIFSGIRKGHKADIKHALKCGYEISVYGVHNITTEVFDSYRKIHFEAAGGQTRPDITWQMMDEWIRAGKSILALCRIDGENIAASFVNTFKRSAYYQSGATLSKYKKVRGIGHLIQWEIIRFLKKHAFANYELGWDWCLNISQGVADAKMLGISRFKSGFGADKYPVFRGEYFNSFEYMEQVYLERMRLYWEQKKIKN